MGPWFHPLPSPSLRGRGVTGAANAMAADDILAQVNAILVEGFEIDPGMLRPEAHLANDLGLDSLDGVDLVVAIEKRFGCRIGENEARAVRTVGDIYAMVERHAGAVGKGAPS